MRNPKIEFDQLAMYFGDPYEIDCGENSKNIVVTQPKIGKIVKFGENRFYSTLNIFIANTTMYRLKLWKHGIDWNTISDFELFCMLYKAIDTEASQLIFKDLDFSKFDFREYTHPDGTVELVLWDGETLINADIYNHFSQYLQNVFYMFPEEKITSDPIMKKWFIRKDERQAEIDEEKRKHGKLKEEFSIQPVISACINHPGFKYNLKDLNDIGVCEFYDSVKRLQIYESSTALMKGIYSGFVSGKDINPESYNFMRSVN